MAAINTASTTGFRDPAANGAIVSGTRPTESALSKSQ